VLWLCRLAGGLGLLGHLGDESVALLEQRQKSVDDGGVLTFGDPQFRETCGALGDGCLGGRHPDLLLLELGLPRRQLGRLLVDLGGNAVAVRLEAAEELLAQAFAPSLLSARERGRVRQASVHAFVIVA
jgi:hypothetical protein